MSLILNINNLKLYRNSPCWFSINEIVCIRFIIKSPLKFLFELNLFVNQYSWRLIKNRGKLLMNFLLISQTNKPNKIRAAILSLTHIMKLKGRENLTPYSKIRSTKNTHLGRNKNLINRFFIYQFFIQLRHGKMTFSFVAPSSG